MAIYFVMVEPLPCNKINDPLLKQSCWEWGFKEYRGRSSSILLKEEMILGQLCLSQGSTNIRIQKLRVCKIIL